MYKLLTIVLIIPFLSFSQPLSTAGFKTIDNISYFVLPAAAGTDVTKELQTAIGTYKNVLIENPYYVFKPLNISNNCRLRGTTNAALISTDINIINITGDNNLLDGITFSPSGKVDPDGAVVYVTGGHNTIRNLVFNYTFTSQYPKAVWLSGPRSFYNLVEKNLINGLGITFDWIASFNSINENKIYNSPGNGVSGIGNGKAPCQGNQVTNNLIVNTGRIGIEDQQYTVNTLIKGNIVVGTGWLYPGHDLGISAVGITPVIKVNTVKQYKTMGIEMHGNRGGICEQNEIEDLSKKWSGVMLNYISPADSTVGMVTVKDNEITGCALAIDLYGTNTPNAFITGNKLSNFNEKGIRVDCEGDNLNISIENNNFYYKTKASKQRYGIFVNGGINKSNQKLSLKSNQFYYENGLPKEQEIYCNIDTSVSITTIPKWY